MIALLFIVTSISCENVKRVARGDLDNGNHYEILYFPYVHLEKHIGAKDCQIFNAQIKNKDNKIEEELIWYTCDSVLPLKLWFTKTSDTSKHITINYLIADTTGNFTSPFTGEEQKTLSALYSYFTSRHIPLYPILGFKTPSKKDSSTSLPFLNKVILMKYYGH